MTTENQIVIIKQQYGIKETYFFFFIELLKIQAHSFAYKLRQNIIDIMSFMININTFRIHKLSH